MQLTDGQPLEVFSPQYFFFNAPYVIKDYDHFVRVWNGPILGPDDLAGLKLRLPVVPTWVAVWKELGAEPVPITLLDLYQALKDGRAEASEGDLPQIVSFADRKLVTDAMGKACEWATAQTETNENNLLAQLKAAGMTVSTPDAAAIRAKAKPAVEQLFKTAWPVTTWPEVLAQ